MHAYNIEMLTRPVDRADPEDRGWCFGLPPGIKPEQWPLDPANGYPLVHGFTMLLPEDYRCHGSDIVALSLFGTPEEMNDGGPASTGAEPAFARDAPEPDDSDLRDLWARERHGHPRLFRMQDGIDCNWALILLTAAEYAGPLCPVPALSPNRLRDGLPPPQWLTIGAARAYYGDGSYRFIHDALGGEPPADVAFDRAIRWTPRRLDPNAGVPTCDAHDEDQTGYQQRFYWADGKIQKGNYRVHAWVDDHAAMHIGGTMHPVQSVPRYSPYHIGFEEEFGGWNFASSGNAQLDFRDMKFDWACG